MSETCRGHLWEKIIVKLFASSWYIFLTVIPYLHSESNVWIFGQIIGFSDSGCFKSPVFRNLNMAMAEPDSNLLVQGCAGRFLTAWCKKCVEIIVWPLGGRAYVCSSSSLFPKAWVSLLPSVLQLTGSAASQEIPRVFGTWKFITVLTSARHLSLSWANFNQSPQPPPTSWRSILILSNDETSSRLY